MASNKELNQWASLKKTMQNRPKNVEMNDVEKYNRWRNNLSLKKKIFKSMFGEASDSEENEGSDSESKEVPSKPDEPTEIPAKKKKKKNKKKKKSQNDDAQVNSVNVSLQKPVNSTQEEKQNAPRVNNQKIKKKEPIKPQGQQKTENKASPTIQQNSKPQNSKIKKSKNENSKIVTEPTSSTEIPKIMTILPSRNHQNNKKRKLEDNQEQKNNFKKRKFDNKKNWKQNNSSSNGIADERLKAFGINPKKFHNKAKYGGQNQKNQSQHQNKKNGKSKE